MSQLLQSVNENNNSVIGKKGLQTTSGPTEIELGSKTLKIQSKRYYLDVKQNGRGKFIKIAEIVSDGRRNNIYLPLSTAAELRDHLGNFSEFYRSLPPQDRSGKESPSDDGGKLKSELIIKDNRRYYLDFKENTRGRFLKISQTIGRGGPRSYMAIPASGLIEFRNRLSDILEEFGSDDGGPQRELPEPQHLRLSWKGYHFDVEQNMRGVYMRISEVQGQYRSSITIPEQAWPKIRDILDDFCDKIENGLSLNSEDEEGQTEDEGDSINGKSNGQTNGDANGHSNGQTNGSANGHSNCGTNGQVNGDKN